jgi:hypothetical protein
MVDNKTDSTDAAAILALEADGHSHHCACRQVWGDGECECPIGAIRAKEEENVVLRARVVELEAMLEKPLTHGQTLAKRSLLAGQVRSLMPARGYTLDCAGCGKPVSIIEARKCHWCGCWYCRICSDAHFGVDPRKAAPAAEEARK